MTLRVWICALMLWAAAGAACGQPAPIAIEIEPAGAATPAVVEALPEHAEALPARPPVALEDGGVELVGRAYANLLDYHITPPAAQGLLESAWREAVAEARRLGHAGPASGPPLRGEREALWAAFRQAYVELIGGLEEEGARLVRFAAIGGMTRALNDCHTFFLPPTRSAALDEVRTGRGGVSVGLELAPVRPAYVREAVSGGPAHRAGIRPGDQLLSVDGRDVTSAGVEVIQDLLRGVPDTTVALAVRRPATGEVLSFSLVRGLVRPAAAEGLVLQGGVGYIRVRAFTTGAALRELVDAIVAQFELAHVRAWVLDLRDNPGGDRDLELAGRFIGPQVAERTLLRDGGEEVNEAVGEEYIRRPVAVLVNGGTASMAEIFAAMLQDYGRARVFGTGTARCAGFVSLEQLADGSTLGVTIARSLTPRSAQALWRTGVLPDEVVRQTADDLALGRDPVLERAVAWLAAQTR